MKTEKMPLSREREREQEGIRGDRNGKEWIGSLPNTTAVKSRGQTSTK